MQRSWEDVLGQRVLFKSDTEGRWQWKSEDLDVRQDPNVWFPSLLTCRLACGAMIYAFFVMEEVTGTDVPGFISPSSPSPVPSVTGSSSPPQGSGGTN